MSPRDSELTALAVDISHVKKPPYLSHKDKDDRATRGRGLRVRTFQLLEELDSHALSQCMAVYGVLEMKLIGPLAT